MTPTLAPAVDFFTEPHGYSPGLGPLDRLRHRLVALDDGFVLIARDGRAWRCYFNGVQRVEILGTVTRAEAEEWLLERAALYGREDGED